MMENGNNKQRIEYAAICNTITNKARQEIQPRDHTRNGRDIKEPEESQKNAAARQRQISLDKQDREIHDQDKIIERIGDIYTELYDSG